MPGRRSLEAVGAVLASRIGELLIERGLTLGVAESCTGGKLGDLITDVPGSSDYFLGGIISYSNEAKVQLLGVERVVLERVGAVSRQVASEMAAGVREKLRADLGIGITGVAGPSGGTARKPVGLVFIAVSSSKGSFITRNLFRGSRDSIKKQSATKALEMLETFVVKHY